MENRYKVEEIAFRNWMQEVDACIDDLSGFISDDLPDCPYRDWFDDDMSPEEAAEFALHRVTE